MRHNVTINSILPGMFHTHATRARFEGYAAANGTSYEIETQRFVDERNIPAGRFGDPVDVGAFCALLCSRYAGFLSGQSIPLDGGIINSVF